MTWPLAPGLARDVPGDLGDSLLNMWILGWGAENVPRLLTGDELARVLERQHLSSRAARALVLRASVRPGRCRSCRSITLTGNLILCYNLLFLSTFVLSALGCICWCAISPATGTRGAFVAGLIYAFCPFASRSRAHPVAQLAVDAARALRVSVPLHRRAARSDAGGRSSGGTAALLMQNWSCGYYLIFFAPFVAAVRRASDVDAPGGCGSWRPVDLACRRGRRGRARAHVAVSGAVPRSAARATASSGRWARSFASRPTSGQLPHGAGGAAAVG